MNKVISGTKEWSVVSVNCITGCEHNCRYCYARTQAMRFKRLASESQWALPVLRPKDVTRRRKKVDGRIMFPTTHDITPQFLGPCIDLLRNLLDAGNDVLIVSKPHLSCIESICYIFGKYRANILFRFTIGAMDDRILSYWEPGAPSWHHRLDCLDFAHSLGYGTSVSCEPCLDSAHVVDLFRICEPYITDSFWIGKANKLALRCVPGTSLEAIEQIERGQTDEAVRRVYGKLKDEPKIRWKESYKAVLGLDLAETAGTDK